MKKKLLLVLMGISIISLAACGKESKNNVVYIDDEVVVTQGAANVDKNDSNKSEEGADTTQTPNQNEQAEITPEIQEPPVIPDKSDDIGNNELGNITLPGEFVEGEVTEEDLRVEKEFSLKYIEKDTKTIVKFYEGAFSLDNVEEVKTFINDSIKDMGWDDNKPVIMEYSFADMGYPDVKGKLITGCVRISENDSYVLHIYLFDIDNETYAFSVENKLSVYDVAINLNYIIPSFSLDNKDLLPDYEKDENVEDEKTEESDAIEDRTSADDGAKEDDENIESGDETEEPDTDNDEEASDDKKDK